MRVVFVDNLLFEDAEGINRYVLQPHLGLISLIAVLERAGHIGLLIDPKIPVARGQWRLDEHLYQSIAEDVIAREPDVVGMTSLGCNFICTAKVAGHIKRLRPDLPILLGGPHASVLDAVILNTFTQFDAIARNEAECTITSLVENIHTGKLWNIPGVTFRTANTVWQNPGAPIIEDLDQIPIPAYHAYPIPSLGLTSIRVDAGRGCPFQCTFCSTASFFGRKYRLKSAIRLVEELDFLHREYGVSDFGLSHDLFTVNRHKVKEFCRAVEGRGYTWKCSARMDCVDADLLEQMAAAGCRSIYYGIEAGSRRMQKIAKKNLDLSLFQPTLDTTQMVGMSATVSFITGYPEETRDDQLATLDLMETCFVPSRRRTALNVQLHLLTPEPGTELLNQHRSSIRYDGHVSDFNFPNLEVDDGEVISSNPQIFINHHYFPAVLPRERHIFVTEIYQHLYALGYPLLHHLIGCCAMTFGQFIDSMYEWYSRERPTSTPDALILREFVAQRFGNNHHLNGLVRYMQQASELRKRAHNVEKHTTTRTPARHPVYALGSFTRLLRNVPDCPQILERIVLDPSMPIPEVLVQRRFSFLLQMQTCDSTTVKNFALTEPAATVFEWFCCPSSLAHFRRSFPSVTGLPLPSPRFMNQMIAKRFLERVDAPH